MASPRPCASCCWSRLPLPRAGLDDDSVMRDLPAGLEGDADFRWILLGQLSRRGLIGAAEIDEALADDLAENLARLRGAGEHQVIAALRNRLAHLAAGAGDDLEHVARQPSVEQEV